jgi:hypothetical protein
MSSDVEAIAARLRADYESPSPDGVPAMATLFADSVELRHDPPIPTDGPIPGATLRDVAIAETRAANRAFTEVVRDNVEVTVDGPSIRVRATTKGTLMTGAAISIDTDVVVEVRDGEIVAMNAHLGDENTARWREALEAGGFERPGGSAGE